MNISFSTNANHYATAYLARKEYDWLNTKQKNYILENLGDMRVQDPTMYPKPRIEIHNNQQKHNSKIMELVGGGEDEK